MEDLLELVFEWILQPFEPLVDDIWERIREIPHKWLRILLRIVLIATPFSLFLVVYLVCLRIFGDG
jgi:hypothetical protein